MLTESLLPSGPQIKHSWKGRRQLLILHCELACLHNLMVSASDRNSRRDQSSVLCLTSWAKCPPLCTAMPCRLLKWPVGVGPSITGLVSGFYEETTENENTSNSLLKSRLTTSQSRGQTVAHPIEKTRSSLWRRVLNSSTFSGRTLENHLYLQLQLSVLWNPIWGIWGNSTPVPPYVLSQLQRMSCFGGGNHPWAHYFLSCAL